MIKKKDFVKYRRKPAFVEIDIKDFDKQSMEKFKVEKGKTRDMKRIMDKLEKEYGFEIEKEKKEKKDKSWLKKDLEW